MSELTTGSAAAGSASEYEPKIVGFLCNWCAYTAADLAGIARIKYPDNIRIVRVMCTGRVEPTFVLKALSAGADAVLVAGCHPGGCHYQEGNYKAYKRTLLLQSMLPQFGIEKERFRLEFVASSEGEKFARVVGDMVAKIKELGPLSGAGTRLAALDGFFAADARMEGGVNLG
ncbi:Methyl-viologen-reducing hydrogenase, delta subunit [Acididesulfobacillus acetoxydans]|uniref:F420-non-reducing hydrogenase vhc iron-sulfur subunit D n=1 Tax=Acididesulfobacillus acetoxydans TaxID=1561005 RepID=A0A8S0XVE1_9FIRM|nr:hydrogenase iron-sulfur subunit [Acididesulfobacillus acetoxydans]CAA7600257.1 Methyl-viologen-reducing hydrogenase, delta subunit [Acididesulfobacillus acetoxydans]CEJ09635.1 F420-non-reducing hydrogenase vhc iron-sulfur subunit D [Acididesulfobacillus acetoxydans]